MADGNKADLNFPVKGRSDSAEHAQRVTLVVGIFEETDNRSRGSDKFGKLPLAETSFGPQFIDFSGDLIIGPRFLQGRNPVGAAFIVAAVHDLHGVASWFAFFGHTVLLLVRVAFRVFAEPLIRRYGPVNLFGRNPLFFYEAMRDYGGDVFVKEIEHAIVHRSKPDA